MRLMRLRGKCGLPTPARPAFFFNPMLDILLHGEKTVNIRDIPLRWKDPEVGSNLKAVRHLTGLTQLLLAYQWRRLTKGIDFPPTPENPGPDALAHEVFSSRSSSSQGQLR